MAVVEEGLVGAGVGEETFCISGGVVALVAFVCFNLTTIDVVLRTSSLIRAWHEGSPGRSRTCNVLG